MKTFGKQTYRLLDNTKPYQRHKLTHSHGKNSRDSNQSKNMNLKNIIRKPQRQWLLRCSVLLGGWCQCLRRFAFAWDCELWTAFFIPSRIF